MFLGDRVFAVRQNFTMEKKNIAFFAGSAIIDMIVTKRARSLAGKALRSQRRDRGFESLRVHEAAIGKIAGEQIIKLMTLGLTEEEAEEQIINGFLK